MQSKAEHQSTDVKWLYSRVLQVTHDLISINRCIRNYKSWYAKDRRVEMKMVFSKNMDWQLTCYFHKHVNDAFF